MTPSTTRVLVVAPPGRVDEARRIADAHTDAWILADVAGCTVLDQFEGWRDRVTCGAPRNPTSVARAATVLGADRVIVPRADALAERVVESGWLAPAALELQVIAPSRRPSRRWRRRRSHTRRRLRTLAALGDAPDVNVVVTGTARARFARQIRAAGGVAHTEDA